MNHVIILAAGKSQRMTLNKDKLFLEVKGNPLIYYSLMAFNDHPKIHSITIVANKNNKKQVEAVVKNHRFPKVRKVILGGSTRQDSVIKGIKSLEKEARTDDVILVHNAANPLPATEEISSTISHTIKIGACIVGRFLTSTVKEVGDRHIVKTHDRKKLFAAETPQAGLFRIFQKAITTVQKNKLKITDEAMMFEAIGQKVAYVEAHEHNFKITHEADYLKLKAILGDNPSDFRVGIGQDSHMFEEKKKGLVLGGLKLKGELKLKANSDGDVILHAIFNALSQAIGDMSLGFYADEKFRQGITDSKKYLTPLLKKIQKQGLHINSLGIMIEAAHPKIDPISPKIKESLEGILHLPAHRIGITATSGEKLSAFGEGLGIQCFAIVSLRKD